MSVYNPHVFKKFVVSAALLAQTTTLEPGVCTSVYGGGVVCGAKHEVVETGLGENLALVGALSILASGVLLYLHRKNSNSIRLS